MVRVRVRVGVRIWMRLRVREVNGVLARATNIKGVLARDGCSSSCCTA
jgi:hypothetical protein